MLRAILRCREQIVSDSTFALSICVALSKSRIDIAKLRAVRLRRALVFHGKSLCRIIAKIVGEFKEADVWQAPSLSDVRKAFFAALENLLGLLPGAGS